MGSTHRGFWIPFCNKLHQHHLSQTTRIFCLLVTCFLFSGQQTALLQLLSQLTPSGSVPAHLVQQLLPLFAVNGNNANLNSLQHQLLDSLPAHNQISNKKQHMVPPFYDAERFLPVSSNASSLLSPHLLATNPLNGCINSGELYSGLLTSLLQNQVNPVSFSFYWIFILNSQSTLENRADSKSTSYEHKSWFD